jgi:hypothetical protein
MSEKVTPWTWHKGVLPVIDEARMQRFALESGRPIAEVRAVVADLSHTTVFMNALYQVNIRLRGSDAIRNRWVRSDFVTSSESKMN